MSALCGGHRSRFFLGVVRLFMVCGVLMLGCDHRARVFVAEEKLEK